MKHLLHIHPSNHRNAALLLKIYCVRRFLAFSIRGKPVLRELMDLQKRKLFVFNKEYLTPELNVNLTVDINVNNDKEKLTRQMSIDSLQVTRGHTHDFMPGIGTSLDRPIGTVPPERKKTPV